MMYYFPVCLVVYNDDYFFKLVILCTILSMKLFANCCTISDNLCNFYCKIYSGDFDPSFLAAWKSAISQPFQ